MNYLLIKDHATYIQGLSSHFQMINLLYNIIYLLATEVTPGLLAGAEPDAHQFYVTEQSLFIDGVTEWKPTQNNIISTSKLGQACIGE
jgi:hypothetical protein